MDLFLFNFLYESVASLQVMYKGLTERFDGGEEACSARRAVDDAVLFDLTTTTSIL